MPQQMNINQPMEAKLMEAMDKKQTPPDKVETPPQQQQQELSQSEELIRQLQAIRQAPALQLS